MGHIGKSPPTSPGEEISAMSFGGKNIKGEEKKEEK
jgi:hypothetical protein